VNAKQRILIVDDYAPLRAGLRGLLVGEPDLEVVGEAGNGRDAIHAVWKYSPDLVLLDLSMPGMNGIEALTQIKSRYPNVRVLIMTLHNTDEFIHASFKAGADGYILKDAMHKELRTAIHSVWAGETYLSMQVSAKVVSAYQSDRQLYLHQTSTIH
jgi:DNA-binding NarL/FixJ family response regulator